MICDICKLTHQISTRVNPEKLLFTTSASCICHEALPRDRLVTLNAHKLLLFVLETFFRGLFFLVHQGDRLERLRRDNNILIYIMATIGNRDKGTHLIRRRIHDSSRSGNHDRSRRGNQGLPAWCSTGTTRKSRHWRRRKVAQKLTNRAISWDRKWIVKRWAKKRRQNPRFQWAYQKEMNKSCAYEVAWE